MTMRRARLSGRQDTGAAQRTPATSEQLVAELYRAHALRLTRMALLLGGGQPSAEDLVQDAFLGLYQLTGVIHLATRQVTTWSYGKGGLRPPLDGNLSLTANGSVLGFTAGYLSGHFGLTNVWVLPTNSPGGPLTRHAHKVLHLRAGVFRVFLSHTGSHMYVETKRPARGAQ